MPYSEDGCRLLDVDEFGPIVGTQQDMLAIASKRTLAFFYRLHGHHAEDAIGADPGVSTGVRHSGRFGPLAEDH